MTRSLLEMQRTRTPVEIPSILENLSVVTFLKEKELPCDPKVRSLFSHSTSLHLLQAQKGEEKALIPLRIGVLFSGGPAPGGHNVIAGLFDALQQSTPEGALFGFFRGPEGLLQEKYCPISAQSVDAIRNTGGFTLLGSSRTKIETHAQMQLAMNTCNKLRLDGLVVIGGDDSNTNAAMLGKFFLDKNCPTCIVGVPKTIDGDLTHAHLPLSFGFDTACRVYAEMIGNLCMDAASTCTYTHFVKLMGRSASHIALECALTTHPNYTLIAEEIALKKQTLRNIVNDIADLVMQRSALHKNYGVILIPEGLIEFIPEISLLIKEINGLLGQGEPTSSFEIIAKLSSSSRKCLESLPESVQKQLFLRRDPHGNVQVSLIETEKLLAELVSQELDRRKEQGTFSGTFHYRTHFFGYEGRSSFPSLFDSTYCYALGMGAYTLIKENLTNHLVAIDSLALPIYEWSVQALPLLSLLHMEEREGQQKAVIRKTLVDCSKKAFLHFARDRDSWRLEDDYQSPGPMQFPEYFDPFFFLPQSYLNEHVRNF